MKTEKIFLLLACLVISVILTAQSAIAGCNQALGVDPIVTDPNARGTKLSGPLTIYIDDGEDTLYYFVRLRKGSKLYLFAGSTAIGVMTDLFSLETQDLIHDWFDGVVIPGIFGVSGVDYNGWALKSYDLDVVAGTDDGQVNLPGAVNNGVTIIDIVVAVDE